MLVSSAGKWGKEVAKGLNALLRETDFVSCGEAVAKYLNAGINFVFESAYTFDGKLFGDKIADGINGFFNTFDFKKLASSLNKWVDNLEDALRNAIKGIKWGEVFKKAITFAGDVELDTLALLIGAFSFKFAPNAIATLATNIGSGIASQIGSAIPSLTVPIPLLLIMFADIKIAKDDFDKWKLENELTDEDIKSAFSLPTDAIKKVWEKDIDEARKNTIAGVKNRYGQQSDATEFWRSVFGSVGDSISLTIDFVKGNIDDLSSWSSQKIDMVANFTKWNKDKSFSENIDNMVANFKSWILSVTFGKIIDNMIAKFTGKKDDGGSWLSSAWGDFTGLFTGKKKSSNVSFSDSFGSSFQALFSKKEKSSRLSFTDSFGSSFQALFSNKRKSSNLNFTDSFSSGFQAMFKSKTSTNGLLGGRWGSYTAWYTKKEAKSGLLSGVWGAFTALFTGKSTAKKADGGILVGGQWKPVNMYAGGGMPDSTSAEVFIAREAGPELVGRIGSSTTVMNNDQIVASVSAGVKQAVSEAMANFGKGTTQVNVSLQGDAKGLFKVVKQENNRIVMATGQTQLLV